MEQAVRLATAEGFCAHWGITLNTTFPFNFTPGIAFWGFAIGWILTAVVHLCFAAAVFNDAETLLLHAQRKTVLVGCGLWALATLLGGVFVAAIYWLLHHSSIFPPPPTTVPDLYRKGSPTGVRPPPEA
jgi:hypothetical protein